MKYYTITDQRSRSTHPHRQTNQKLQITAKWTFLEQTGNLQTGPMRPLEMPHMLQTHGEKGPTLKFRSLPGVLHHPDGPTTTSTPREMMNTMGTRPTCMPRPIYNGREKPDKRLNKSRDHICNIIFYLLIL